MLGDRAYGVPKYFAILAGARLHGLCRRGARVLCREVERISETRWEGGRLEDLRVEAGSSSKTATQRLRLLRWTRGRRTLELLTDIADTATMSAAEAMALYRERWKVERLFHDLKEVLDLHSFYGANHNVVAMQVYATALVHTAMRVAQSRIAAAARVAPEDLSPAKLFPRIAAASAALTWAEFGFQETRRANPGARLTTPDWRTMPFTSTPLTCLLVEQRSERRKVRGFCASRGRWRSLPPGRRKRRRLS